MNKWGKEDETETPRGSRREGRHRRRDTFGAGRANIHQLPENPSNTLWRTQFQTLVHDVGTEF
jgi:hypothetical protein